ncbi:tetratricopeptide repeat protein [uncultured Ilyobacter sp.]|uniref:tetratricopeptide repeat protein n=1 Tax=uncultured Ilyobacter sp. TaxID=544433 RepID=UPI0029F49873|nr:tetratricopeptide repeat protein [uncultured Ilyobacter sp.]
MKKKLTIMAFLIVLNTMSFAGEKEDIKYIDELYRSKNYKVAVLELEGFLKNYPKSKYVKTIQERLAKTYFMEKNHEKSKKYFDILLANYRLKRIEKDEFYYYQTVNCAYLGNFDDAIAYQKNLDVKSDYYDKAVYELGKEYYNSGGYNKAQIELSRLLSSKGEYYAKGVLYLALSSYNNEQYVKSIVYLDEYYKGTEKDKNYPLMNYIYGSCYYKMDDIAKAEGYFKEVAEKYPEDTYAQRSLLSLVSIYRDMKNETEMMSAVSKLKEGKEADTAYKLVAEYNLNKGDYSNSARYYEKIVSGSDDPSVIYGYAYSLFKKGEKTKSLNYFKNLKETEYEDDALYYSAFINYEKNRYKDVLELTKDLDGREVKPLYNENLYLMMASSAYETGKYKLSRDYYMKVYEKSYRKDELYKIIVVNSKIGDMKDLKIRFDEYRKTFVRDQQYKKDVYLAVGASYYAAGDISKAQSVYEEYLRSSRDEEILGNLIAILLNEKQYEKMSKYLNMQNSSPENTYLKGIVSLGMMRYQDAESYFKKAAESGNSEIKEKAQYNLLKTYFSWEKYSEAVETGESYLGKGYGKNKGDVLDKIALSYFRMGEYEKSRESYEKLEGIEGYSDYALFQTGESFYSQGEYKEASKIYREIYNKDPKGKYAEDSLYWEINSLYNLEEFELLKKSSSEFLKNYKKSTYRGNVMLFSADANMASEDFQGAIATYKELYGTTEDENLKGNSASKLTEIYYKGNSLDDALLWADKIPVKNKASYWKAITYDKKGEVDLAHAEYKKLLEDEKYKDRVAFNLANYYFKKENYTESKKYYEIVDRSSESQYKDTAAFQLGVIYEKEEDFNNALRMFTKVNLLYEDSPLKESSVIKIAVVYESMGDEKEAKKSYNEFLEQYKESKFKDFVLEKLISMNLKEENKEEAFSYYEELKEKSPEKSKKYIEYFEEGEKQ